MSNDDRTCTIGAVLLVGVVMLLWLMVLVCLGGAQCLDADSRLMFDTSASCASQPSIPRVFGSERFTWGARSMLAVNIGNEIQLWDITDPGAPVFRERSSFRVGNVGDSDYDLQNFAFCDGCRYGVANYKRASVFFDLGSGGWPSFDDWVTDYERNIIPGGAVYANDGAVYLVAEGGEDCAGSGVYRFDGPGARTLIGCLAVPGFVPQVVDGRRVGGALYLVDKSTRVWVFEIGAGGALTYHARVWDAYSIKDTAQDFDQAAGLATVARGLWLEIHDISDPLNPVHVASIAADCNRSTVAYPWVFVARKGYANSERTFDISDPANPVEVSAEFWEWSNDWNWPGHQCSEVQAARFSADGSNLYRFAYSRAQRIAVNDCAPVVEVVFGDGFESGTAAGWSAVVN